LDAKELVEELFRLDEGIRWVGVADQQGNILQNIQRPDTESFTDKNTDELTLHVFPTIMGLLWGRLVGTGIGDLKSVVVAYGRLYLMAFYVDELLVVLTFELKGIPNVLDKINERFGVGFARLPQ
jgi:hypothetical protein